MPLPGLRTVSRINWMRQVLVGIRHDEGCGRIYSMRWGTSNAAILQSIRMRQSSTAVGQKVEHVASAKLYPSCKPASTNASQPRLSYPDKLPCTRQNVKFRISRTENSMITDTWNAVDDYLSRGLVKS